MTERTDPDMITEIGSEFHISSASFGGGLTLPRKGSFTFSGRTAIEAVLKKIPNAKTALLPSYCCDSMIDPFRRAGLRVDFFDVNYNGSLTFKIEKKADILLWCNYFGFKNDMPEFDGIVIEDITHSLLSEKSCHVQSDYLIASVRKWFPICCGGYCSIETSLASPPDVFIKNKLDAMQLKEQYLRDGDADKKVRFLSEFGESNKWLANNYSDLGIDTYSTEYLTHVNVADQVTRRRKNAHTLYKLLGNNVEFMFSEEDMDCPLFVPIILRKDRNEIRRALSAAGIYCPTHWPRPGEKCNSELYEWELSLICDQRYNEKDMERIASILCNNV